MATSLISLSSPTPSTTTRNLRQFSSHFKVTRNLFQNFWILSQNCNCLLDKQGNVTTLKACPTPFTSIKLCHHKSKQRQPLVVLNSAASGVQISNENVRFRLDNLGPQPGSRKKAKRKGRGHAAGQGGSCGFGMRGQKSRSGPGVRRGFEGGQMPLYRRIPKLRGIAGGKPFLFSGL